jgi:glycosyltransferase involved in cell wall biosynthesis
MPGAHEGPPASVVHVMGWYSQQYGSFERFLVALSRHCREAGIDTHLVFPSQPASAAFVRDVDCPIHIVPSPRNPADPVFASRLMRLLRRSGATHLHAHFGIDAYHALAVAGMAGVRRRYTTKHHVPSFARPLAARLIHRWLASRVETVFAVSDHVAGCLLELGVPPEKVVTCRLGVDPATYRPSADARREVRKELGISEETRIVLSVSHLRPGKGTELLSELAAGLAQDPGDAVVLVAGDGPLRDAVRESAERLGVLGSSLRFLGVREDVPELMAASDLVVFPTTGEEGMGLAAFEALAAGAPLVVTSVSDFPELVGDAAIVVPPQSPDELLEGCRRVLGDRDATERRVASGRELVERELNVAVAVEAHPHRSPPVSPPAASLSAEVQSTAVRRSKM